MTQWIKGAVCTRRLLPLLATLAALVTLVLPSESLALIRQNPTPGSFFASEWKTCRNDPVNNSDPLGLWAWDRDWIQMGVGGLFGAYGSDVAVSGWAGVGSGAKNEIIGAAKIVKETGAMVADVANATAEITTGHSLYDGDLGSSMQALSSGKLTAGQYYTVFGANAVTLGTYGQAKATVQMFNDEISADEYSQQVGGAGIVQLVGAKVMGSGGTKTGNLSKAGNLTKSSVADDMAGSGRLGGEVYNPTKLSQLGGYLERRGVKLMTDADDLLPNRTMGQFKSFSNERGIMYLRRNPTVLEVKHELSHYLDFRKYGFQRYSAVTRAAREQSVYNRLRLNRSWAKFTPEQKDCSYMYLLDVGGNPLERPSLNTVKF